MLVSADPRLRLCAVTDDLRDGPSGLVARCAAAERGGASMVLLRLKHADAHTLMEVGLQLVASLTIPVIVNERLDVALACGAAGVHLTAASMPVIAIRAQVSGDFLIGGSISTADDLTAAQAADYVTIGPVFDGQNGGMGVEGFTRMARAVARPAIAIGGITPSTAADVRLAGAAGVAAIRAILSAGDPAVAAAALR